MIQKIKDLLDLIKQLVILFLFLMLFFAPSYINSVLVNAGITKVSFMGVDWEKQIKNSRDSLELAKQQVQEVQGQLKALGPQIDLLQQNAISPTDKTNMKGLNDSLHSSIIRINMANNMLNRNLILHDKLINTLHKYQ